jgi:glycosyltransferase involved in cell wall biosynthesis
MSKNNLIFIGTIKKVANCGESMKNHIMLHRFREIYDCVLEFDTWGAKHYPWRITKLLWYLLRYPNAKIVVSASTYIAYDVFRFLKLLGKKNVYYWVIGGVFPQLIEKNHYNPAIYRNLKGIFVESPRMVHDLEQKNINNAVCIPNFKRIDYQPAIDERDYGKVRFVFLSRVHPDKGCSLIVESANRLNAQGYHDRFSIDFYGPVDPIYSDFETSIEGLDNVNYQGFLKLDPKGYDILAKYSMMLFPTFWQGEGFPGIVVDAFTAGLPVLASDWNFNPDIIDDGVTGIIIPHNNLDVLEQAMQKVIDGVFDLKTMANNSYQKAKEYDDRKVLSIEQLKTLTVFE